MPPTREDLDRQLAVLERRVAELESRDRRAHQVAGDPAAAELLTTLLENVPGYVYFEDTERRFVCVSRSFERLHHRAAADIVRRRDEGVVPQ